MAYIPVAQRTTKPSVAPVAPDVSSPAPARTRGYIPVAQRQAISADSPSVQEAVDATYPEARPERQEPQSFFKKVVTFPFGAIIDKLSETQLFREAGAGIEAEITERRSREQALKDKILEAWNKDDIGAIAGINKKLDEIKGQRSTAQVISELPEDIRLSFKTFSQAARLFPANVRSAYLQGTRGIDGASVVKKDAASQYIKDVKSRSESLVEKVQKEEYGNRKIFGSPITFSDITKLPQNLGFSLVSMGAGLTAGVPSAYFGPIAAWGIGTTASGKAAFEMSSYQITQQFLEAKNEEKILSTGKGLTEEEEVLLKDQFRYLAMQYGLWEAVPEAISNAAFLKILTIPLSKMIGSSLAIKVAEKVSGIYAEEFLTETITQMGQTNVEVRAGMSEEAPRDWRSPEDWSTSFKEIAPQTFLLTTLMAGAGQVIISSKDAYEKIRKSLEAEMAKRGVPDSVANEIIATVPDEQQRQEEDVKKQIEENGMGESIRNAVETNGEQEVAQQLIEQFGVAPDVASRAIEIALTPAVPTKEEIAKDTAEIARQVSLESQDTGKIISRTEELIANLREGQDRGVRETSEEIGELEKELEAIRAELAKRPEEEAKVAGEAIKLLPAPKSAKLLAAPKQIQAGDTVKIKTNATGTEREAEVVAVREDGVVAQVKNDPNFPDLPMLYKNKQFTATPHKAAARSEKERDDKRVAEKARIKELREVYVTGKKLNEGLNVNKIAIEDNRTDKTKEGVERIKEVIGYKTKIFTGRSGMERTVHIPDVITEKVDEEALQSPEKKSVEKEKEAQPGTAQEAADQYWDAVIQPAIDRGEAVIIGADDLKDFFGKDYDLKNHGMYSRAAFLLYTRALKEVKNPLVKLTVGGTGAGKSDFVVPDASMGFDGIIYDSTGWKYEDGLKNQIEEAERANKNVSIYSIIPDLRKARAYTFLRELKGEHPVTEAAFVRTHAGAIRTMIKAIKDGVRVYVMDARGVVLTKGDFDGNPTPELNPLAKLESLGYNEKYVTDTIRRITTETAQSVLGSGAEDGAAQRSGEGGAQNLPQEDRTGEIIDEFPDFQRQPRDTTGRFALPDDFYTSTQGGFSPLHFDDYGTLVDFIDFSRGIYRPSPDQAHILEINTKRILEDVFDQKTEVQDPTLVKKIENIVSRYEAPDTLMRPEFLAIPAREGELRAQFIALASDLESGAISKEEAQKKYVALRRRLNGVLPQEFQTSGQKKVVPADFAKQKLEEYKKRLKLNFNVSFVDVIFTGDLVDGEKEKAYAVTFDNNITVAKNVTRTTADHEMIHVVLSNLEKIDVMHDIDRTELLRAANDGVDALPEDLPRLSEKLAVDFENYMRNVEQPGLPGIVRRFFERLKYLLTDMYTALGGEMDVISDFYRRVKFARSKESTDFSTKGITEMMLDGGRVLDFSRRPPRTKERTDFLRKGFTDEEFDALPESDRNEVMEEAIMSDIQGYGIFSPEERMADDLLTGARKIRATEDMKTKLREALGPGLYMNLVRKDDTLSSFDELTEEVREDVPEITTSELLDAILARKTSRDLAAQEQKAIWQEAREVRQKELAEAKTEEEKVRVLRKIERDLYRELTKKRYTLGQYLKAIERGKSSAFKGGYKEGQASARVLILNQLRVRQESVDNVRREIVTYAKENLPLKELGKLLPLVRGAKTQTDLIKAYARIDRVAEVQVKANIIREIKVAINKLSSAKNIAVEYKGKIMDLVEDITLSKSREATLEKLRRTQEYFATQKAEGKDVVTPQRVLKALSVLKKKPIADMDVADLKNILEQMELLKTLGETKLRTRQELYDIEKQQKKDAIIAETVAIEKHPLLIPRPGEKLTKTAKLKNLFPRLLNFNQHLDLSITPMDVFFDLLGGGDASYSGAPYRIFKRTTDNNYSKYLLRKDIMDRAVWAKAEELNLNDQNFERIGVHAARVQEGGIDKLLSTGLTEAEIEEIDLTGKEMEMYDFMREKLDLLRPHIALVMRDVYNQELGNVQNYFSFITDFKAMDEAEVYQRIGEGVEEVGQPRKNPEMGFTITRVGGAQKIKLNAMEIFLQHTDNASYLIEMARDNRMLHEIANSPEYKEASGELGSKMTMEWIDLVSRKGGKGGNEKIAILDTLRRNMGVALLGFKLSSAIIQPTALMDGAAKIGKYAFLGAKDITTNREIRAFVLGNMPEVKNRVGGDPSFLDMSESETLRKVQEAGYWALKKLDAITASSIAWGAYRKKLDELGIGVDLESPNMEAIAFAQQTMRRTQSSHMFKDVPLAISKGGLTGNRSFDRALLQFQTFMLNRWSLIRHDLYRAGIRGGVRSIKDRDFRQAFGVAFFLLMAALAEEGLRRASKELIAFLTGSDVKYQDGYTAAVSKSVLTTVPFIGQGVNSISYESEPIPALGFKDALERGVSGVGGKKESTKMKGLVRLVEAGGMVAGIPGSSQASQIARGAIGDD